MGSHLGEALRGREAIQGKVFAKVGVGCFQCSDPRLQLGEEIVQNIVIEAFVSELEQCGSKLGLSWLTRSSSPRSSPRPASLGLMTSVNG
jgi:hypothetical protein